MEEDDDRGILKTGFQLRARHPTRSCTGWETALKVLANIRKQLVRDNHLFMRWVSSS